MPHSLSFWQTHTPVQSFSLIFFHFFWFPNSYTFIFVCLLLHICSLLLLLNVFRTFFSHSLSVIFCNSHSTTHTLYLSFSHSVILLQFLSLTFSISHSISEGLTLFYFFHSLSLSHSLCHSFSLCLIHPLSFISLIHSDISLSLTLSFSYSLYFTHSLSLCH